MEKQYSTGAKRKTLSVKREGYKVKGERVQGEGGRRKAEGDRRERYKVKGERVQGEGGKRFNPRSTDKPASLRGSRSESKQPRTPRRFNEPRSKDTKFKDSKIQEFKKSRTKDFEDKKPYRKREALSVKREGYKVKGEGYKVKGERVKGERAQDSKFKVQGSRFKSSRSKDSEFKASRTKSQDSKFNNSRSRDSKPSRRRFSDDSHPAPRTSHPAPRTSSRDGIRLNKFIANSGICSRREADEYIVAGLVTVNGKVVTEMGVKVQPNDEVRFNNERLKGEQKVYIVMNKPKDFVTTMSDPYAEKTVMDLIGEKCPSRVFPVGRLDKATTGVLLFTNDGELTEQLTHPSYNKKKIYHIFLDKNLKQADLQQLLDGVELEDGLIQADSISYVDEDNAQVGLEIHSGRNRVVRRMFEALGYKVKKLDRVYFAGLTKKNLKRGQWRFLTDAEVNMLRMGAYE